MALSPRLVEKCHNAKDRKNEDWPLRTCVGCFYSVYNMLCNPLVHCRFIAREHRLLVKITYRQYNDGSYAKCSEPSLYIVMVWFNAG